MLPVYHAARDSPIASRIIEGTTLREANSRFHQDLRPDRVSRGGRIYGALTPRHDRGERPDRVSREVTSSLSGPNPASELRLRQDRVSHLGAHTAQEGGHLAGRDRLRRRPRPARLDVVLVVAPGHGPGPPPPPSAGLSMAVLLAGRGSTGPLPRAQPRVGPKEGRAEGTGASPHAGHRSPPGGEADTVPQHAAPLGTKPGR